MTAPVFSYGTLQKQWERRRGKERCTITVSGSCALSAFSSYQWPGNIRELQNLIERAVILSNDGVLPNPLPTAGTRGVIISPAATTLMDSERTLILRTLEGVGWVIGGERGIRQTWLEAHYADPQDAEAGDFSALFPKHTGCNGASSAGAGLAGQLQ